MAPNTLEEKQAAMRLRNMQKRITYTSLHAPAPAEVDQAPNPPERQKRRAKTLQPPPDLHLVMRRLAATVLCFQRGWSTKEIARVFQWPVRAVEAWFEAGKPLL